MLTHKGTAVIHTERLILRPFTVEDGEDMYSNWASEPEVTRFLTWLPHENADVTRSLLEEWVKNYENPAYYNWVMEYSGQCIGNISIVRQSDRSEYMEFGYCMGSRWRHMGLMTEGVAALTDYLFREVNAHRLVICHAADNPASGRVAEKCGFTKEGVQREKSLLHDGLHHDIVIHSLLRSEWEKRNQPVDFKLETERLLLRPITEADAVAAHRYAGDPEVTRYMYFGGNESLGETRSFLRECRRMWALRDQRDWEFAMVLKESGEVIGACDFCREEGGYELGWVLAKEYWKKGYATEAAQAMAHYLFTSTDCHRIFSRCDAENTGSRRVMEKLGMVREAVFRKARPTGNDEYLYAILKEDWQG